MLFDNLSIGIDELHWGKGKRADNFLIIWPKELLARMNEGSAAERYGKESRESSGEKAER